MNEEVADEPIGSVGQWTTDSDLEDYDEAAIDAVLDEEVDDPDLLGGALPEQDGRPVVAILGRPNVGKSTLVNRVLGRREAVVQDIPGVTRDRVYYPAHWAGKDFILVDTGGWIDKARGMSAQVAVQAERAAAEADVVVLVVDATVGATDEDEAVVRLLRRSKAPVVLVANKVDDRRTEADAAGLWALGMGEPFPVSALHGRGSGDMLDAVVAAMPEVGGGRVGTGPHRIALVGKPNVGKSSLLNRLAGEQRAVVDAVAGTTVDPVDEVVVLGGEEWLFVDTAGIRRRVREASGQEFYASLRTRSAVERSEVAVVLIDASEPLTDQDLRIIGGVVEAGRGLVLAFNKWDRVDEERQRYLRREIDRDLVHVWWAPRVNVSALTGRRVDGVAPAVSQALDGWQSRVSTGRLNAFLKEIISAHPHPVRGGKQPRVLFGTQASVGPPTFVLFTTGVLEAQYRRFIERRLREQFGFTGTPIRIDQRVRAKRQRR